MSNFFVRLAERATGKGLTVRPLFSSRYSSEAEAQGFSDVGTESRMGNAQVPIELSISNALDRPQPRSGSPLNGLPRDDQGRDNQSTPTPTERTRFPSSPLSGRPSIDAKESPGVAPPDNRQTTFRQDSRRDMSSTKPSNMGMERLPVLPILPVLDPSRHVAMGDLEHSDFQSGMPVHRDPGLTAPERLAFHQNKPLLSPTPTRSNSAEPRLSATATVDDLLTQPAAEESVRVGSIEQWPIEPTPQFDLTTVPARLDTHRSDVIPPVVRVTIGRIEVRAIMPVLMSERPRPTRPQPVISLDDYLKQGKGAVR